LSLRFLYRKLPVTERVCSYYRCQRPILRNIARDKDGHLYHWGCLQSARDEQYRCLECWTVFDGTRVAFHEVQSSYSGEFRASFTPACPECGSFNLKNLRGGSD